MSPKSEDLLRPRDAAVVLGISYATLKQWIYKGKLRTVRTAGGHHRVPQSQLDRYLYKSLGLAVEDLAAAKLVLQKLQDSQLTTHAS